MVERHLAQRARAQFGMRAQALAAAGDCPRSLAVADFFLDENEPGLAAKRIFLHPEGFPGEDYDTLLPMAETLAEDHPGAAWVLYRAILLNILEEARYGAYGHAARHLRKTRALAPRAQRQDDQLALEAQLAQDHKRKTAFWKKVNG